MESEGEIKRHAWLIARKIEIWFWLEEELPKKDEREWGMESWARREKNKSYIDY